MDFKSFDEVLRIVINKSSEDNTKNGVINRDQYHDTWTTKRMRKVFREYLNWIAS